MEDQINELFWNADMEEMKQGYIDRKGEYTCIVCGESFTKGRIYPMSETWYDAQKRVELHVKEQHGSMLEYLLSRNNSFIGVTEIQKTLLQLLGEGKSDKEVAGGMGIHPSTVRNHRYRLREKEKQAKLFLTVMNLLEEAQDRPMGTLDKTQLAEVPKTATMIDDRYDMTDQEKEKIIQTYFNEVGMLKNYPSKEKRKIIVLQYLCKNFKVGKVYSEVEVNRVLKRIWEDHVTLRRALIEYGFMERAHDGQTYWLKV